MGNKISIYAKAVCFFTPQGYSAATTFQIVSTAIVPENSYCLSLKPVSGTRKDRIVVIQLGDEVAPEIDERYTIKTYKSEKSKSDDGGWRHLKINLKPRNPDYQPIEFTTYEEGKVEVIAEFLEVLN